jgi:hypothetical protein
MVGSLERRPNKLGIALDFKGCRLDILKTLGCVLDICRLYPCRIAMVGEFSRNVMEQAEKINTAYLEHTT